MELSNIFQSGGEDSRQPFLCVIISSTHVQSFLLGIRSELQVDILSESKSYTYSDDKNLLLKTDESLQDLGAGSEAISQVLFGIDPSWVDASGLKGDRREFLHKLAAELSLEAKGYVMSTESLIAHYRKASASVAGLVVLTSAEQIDALVLVDGEVAVQETIGRSAEIGADFTELLARVSQWSQRENQQLPPRLMLASLNEAALTLEDYRQYLLSLDWGQFPLFMHLPTVELVPPDTFSKIMIQQAALAAQNSGLINITDPVALKQSVETDDISNVTEVDPASIRPNSEVESEFSDFYPSTVGQSTSSSRLASMGGKINRFSPFKWLNKRQVSASAAHRRNPKPFIALGIGMGMVALVLIAWGYAHAFSRVVVRVERQSRPISAEVVATLGKETGGSPENYTLAATSLNVTIQKTLSQQTTGVEDVGEAAEGEVTIFNKTEAKKTLVKGTVFSADKLKFELVEDVTLPEATVSATEGGSGEIKSFGQAVGKLRAEAIGEDGNIGDGVTFQIANFSQDTYSATAKGSFSGGSSQEVQVVARDDYDQLLSQIKKEVLKDAQTEIEAKLKAGQYYTQPILSKLDSSEYSADLGDEAEVVELTVTASVETLTYTVLDINQLAAVVLDQELPPGYELASGEPEVLSQPVESEEEVANQPDETDQQISLKLTSWALPLVDLGSLTDSIKGKTVAEAINTLQARNDIKTAQIYFDPSIVSKLIKSLPPTSERISIELTQK